ncbi:MAG: hypothetical protein ACXVDD_03380 [Polyangia bacterium]
MAPAPASNQAMKFTAARTSVYGTFVVGIAVVTILEMPVVHVLLHKASWWVHALIVAANIGALVWIFRERRRMRDAAHTLDAEALSIALPGKWRGAIPVALIASVRRISPAPGTTRPRGTIRVTPLDTPNVELSLRAPATLTGSFGLDRSAARVQLFVDEPDEFVRTITTRLVPAP